MFVEGLLACEDELAAPCCVCWYWYCTYRVDGATGHAESCKRQGSEGSKTYWLKAMVGAGSWDCEGSGSKKGFLGWLAEGRVFVLVSGRLGGFEDVYGVVIGGDSSFPFLLSLVLNLVGFLQGGIRTEEEGECLAYPFSPT